MRAKGAQRAAQELCMGTTSQFKGGRHRARQRRPRRQHGWSLPRLFLIASAVGIIAGLVLFEVGPKAIGGRADPSGFWEKVSEFAGGALDASGFGNCHIKGNVSFSGERIYHVPDGMFYSETRIDFLNGERFFCTEAEARSAGWRRSRR